MTIPARLSLYWIFLYLNYIFCDVFSLMNPALIQQMAAGGGVDGIDMTEDMLLGFAIIMELGLIMVLAARFLPRGLNRAANVGVGFGLVLLQIATLFVGTNTLHYLFFSAVEVATLALIVWTALRWREPATDAQFIPAAT